MVFTSLIKTVLEKHGLEFYNENMHWCLAAAMAGCLLDSVGPNRFKGNLP